MEKDLQELAHADEEKLVKELASMRVELTPEADFEARFLADFHERLAETEVATKEKLPFFVRVKAAIASPYGRAWGMGACAVVVVGFLVGGLVTVPEEDDVSVVSVMRIPTSNVVGKARMVECEAASEPCGVAEAACLEACTVSAVACEADEAAVVADDDKPEEDVEQGGE